MLTGQLRKEELKISMVVVFFYCMTNCCLACFCFAWGCLCGSFHFFLLSFYFLYLRRKRSRTKRFFRILVARSCDVHAARMRSRAFCTGTLATPANFFIYLLSLFCFLLFLAARNKGKYATKYAHIWVISSEVSFNSVRVVLLLW